MGCASVLSPGREPRALAGFSDLLPLRPPVPLVGSLRELVFPPSCHTAAATQLGRLLGASRRGQGSPNPRASPVLGLVPSARLPLTSFWLLWIKAFSRSRSPKYWCGRDGVLVPGHQGSPALKRAKTSVSGTWGGTLLWFSGFTMDQQRVSNFVYGREPKLFSHSPSCSLRPGPATLPASSPSVGKNGAICFPWQPYSHGSALESLPSTLEPQFHLHANSKPH